jgi:hypothetical protein
MDVLYKDIIILIFEELAKSAKTEIFNLFKAINLEYNNQLIKDKKYNIVCNFIFTNKTIYNIFKNDYKTSAAFNTSDDEIFHIIGGGSGYYERIIICFYTFYKRFCFHFSYEKDLSYLFYHIAKNTINTVFKKNNPKNVITAIIIHIPNFDNLKPLEGYSYRDEKNVYPLYIEKYFQIIILRNILQIFVACDHRLIISDGSSYFSEKGWNGDTSFADLSPSVGDKDIKSAIKNFKIYFIGKIIHYFNRKFNLEINIGVKNFIKKITAADPEQSF